MREWKKINTKGQRDKGSKEKQVYSHPFPHSSFDPLKVIGWLAACPTLKKIFSEGNVKYA